MQGLCEGDRHSGTPWGCTISNRSIQATVLHERRMPLRRPTVSMDKRGPWDIGERLWRRPWVPTGVPDEWPRACPLEHSTGVPQGRKRGARRSSLRNQHAPTPGATAYHPCHRQAHGGKVWFACHTTTPGAHQTAPHVKRTHTRERKRTNRHATQAQAFPRNGDRGAPPARDRKSVV